MDEPAADPGLSGVIPLPLAASVTLRAVLPKRMELLDRRLGLGGGYRAHELMAEQGDSRRVTGEGRGCRRGDLSGKPRKRGADQPPVG